MSSKISHNNNNNNNNNNNSSHFKEHKKPHNNLWLSSNLSQKNSRDKTKINTHKSQLVGVRWATSLQLISGL